MSANTSTGSSEWMSHGDGTAPSVQLVDVDSELLLTGQRLRTEGLVDLNL